MNTEDREEYIVDILPTEDSRYASNGFGNNGASVTTNGGSLDAIVDQAFGQLLGQRTSEDVNAFQTALENAFVEKKQGNQTVYEWQPYSYTGNDSSDLGGGVTGAQASLYYRAKTILKDVLRLLEGLKPLRTTADPENSDAIRAVVNSEVTELVRELGLPGGPRGQRVDYYFRRLLGENFTAEDSGDLMRLVRTLGLRRNRINTVAEEENYSNYLILRDYLLSLHDSWQTYKTEELEGAYLGPQLVDLSRALAVVAESVRETYRLMNRYFLGPDERRSVVINFTDAADPDLDINNSGFVLPNDMIYTFDADGAFVEILENGSSIPDQPSYAPNLKQSMTIAELLDWVTEFATKEGPMLVQEGGKLGIANAFEEKAFVLMVLVQAAAVVEPKPNSALRRGGVVRSLQDLAAQLYEVKRLASEINVPWFFDDHR